MMFSSAIRNSGTIRKIIFVAAVLVLVAAGMALAKDSSAQVNTTEIICSSLGGTLNGAFCEGLPEDIICLNFSMLADAGIDLSFTSCEDDEDPTPEEQCAIDEGFWNGESCEEVTQCDEGETYNSEDNTCTPTEDGGEDEETENNGGGSSNENTSSGGGSIGGGSLGGGGSMGGQVLGVSTDEVCADPLITSYLGLGRTNDLAQVVKLQIFLNTQLGLTLPVTGTFGSDTEDAVEQFQLKYADEVLAPWVPFGLTSSATPTGYVYKTTKRMINKIHCAALEIPMPQLP